MLKALVWLLMGRSPRHYRLPEPELPCIIPDFVGDTCEFWSVTYGQAMCENCAINVYNRRFR